jgi:hypothetical protein
LGVKSITVFRDVPAQRRLPDPVTTLGQEVARAP